MLPISFIDSKVQTREPTVQERAVKGSDTLLALYILSQPISYLKYHRPHTFKLNNSDDVKRGSWYLKNVRRLFQKHPLSHISWFGEFSNIIQTRGHEHNRYQITVWLC